MDASPNALAEACGTDILGRTASFLPPNEIACTLRLVSRSTAEQFREHTMVRLSQPSPSAAFAAHWYAPGACRALSYARRMQLVCLTAASGDVGNLEVALAAAGLWPTAELLAATTAAGQLHVCRCLAERGCPLEGPFTAPSPLTSAAKGGHAAVCEWLLEQGCAWTEECVTSAAKGGHPELMRALLHKAPPGRRVYISASTLAEVAAEGNVLGTLQDMWRERGLCSDARLLDSAAAAAARSPTPDWAAKVAWLLEQGASRGPHVCAAAASCPDGVARLTLLVEGMGLPVDAAAISAAAESGRVDAVRWLLARGLRPTGMWLNRMSVQWDEGHTEVLRALHAAGCRLPQPWELMRHACRSGLVEAVSWVVETYGAEALHSEWANTFNSALWSGSLELVTWLRERGLGPSPDPWYPASRGGCVAVLELLAEWGADVQFIDFRYCHPYLEAAGRGDLLTLEALRRLGLPLGGVHEQSKELMARAIDELVKPPLPALRWLRRAVGEVDWAAAAEAARRARALAGWRAEVLAWVEAEAQAEAQAQAAVEGEVQPLAQVEVQAVGRG